MVHLDRIKEELRVLRIKDRSLYPLASSKIFIKDSHISKLCEWD